MQQEEQRKWKPDFAELTKLPEPALRLPAHREETPGKGDVTGLWYPALIGTTAKGTISSQRAVRLGGVSGTEQEQGKEVGKDQKFSRLGRVEWVRGPGISHWVTMPGSISWEGGHAATVHATAGPLGVPPQPIWDLWSPSKECVRKDHTTRLSWFWCGNVLISSVVLLPFSHPLSPYLLHAPSRTAKTKLLRDAIYFFDKM